MRAPRRWQQNAGRGSTGAASGEGEAIGASDAGAAAAVPDDARRPSVDGRKMMDELEAWMRRTNLRRAPEAHYLDVETLRDLFVADRAAHAGEPVRNAECDVDLKVFGSLFGIACSKAFSAPRLVRRRGAIGVTCDARAAAPPASALDAASTLWAWAQWSLQNHLYDNAVFLAERVVAEAQVDPSKHEA